MSINDISKVTGLIIEEIEKLLKNNTFLLYFYNLCDKIK